MQKSLASLEETLSQILAQCEAAPRVQSINLNLALGTVLAQDYAASFNVPPFDNSQMDGYALSFEGNNAAANQTFDIVANIAAGDAQSTNLSAGQAARIFTGAPLPQGAAAIVPQENVRVTGNAISLNGIVKANDFIRRAGCDIAQGKVFLSRGERLSAAHIGLAASMGLAELSVYEPLTIGVLTTGNELVAPGQPLSQGKIYNSNAPMLAALLAQNGFAVKTAFVTDNLPDTVAAFETLSQSCDAIISCGGVSVGAADFIKPAIMQLGELSNWAVAMKPGKPFAFGFIQQNGKRMPVLGLPGNPVSSFVTFALLALPYLQKLQGQTNHAPQRVKARTNFAWTKPDARREFLRVRLENGMANLFPNQNSAVLSSVAWANGLADIASGQTIAVGDELDIILL